MFLSLLIIYSGAGVSIVHYCCAGCETVQSCCATGCPKCKKSHTCDSKKDCKNRGCTATIYKLNLMNHATELTVAAPVVDLFCEQQFCYLLNIGYTEKPVEYIIPSSPPILFQGRCWRYIPPILFSHYFILFQYFACRRLLTVEVK